MEETTNKQGDFVIICQHKLPKEERVDVEGQPKEVHVVIKQSSFIVIISSDRIILDDCTIDCSLVYDNNELNEVHYINQKPISFTSQPTSPNRITCDIRILVLSSQHEEMLFKILFKIMNKDGNTIGQIYSYPIRVISKADGKKKTATKQQKLSQPSQITKQETKPKHSQTNVSMNSNTNNSAVQSMNQSIERIEQQNVSNAVNNQNMEIKQNVIDQMNEKEDSILEILQYQRNILLELTQQTHSNPLANPLIGMINAYKQLPQHQRIPRLLRIITTLSPQDNAIISELVSLIVGINTSVQNDPQQQLVQPFQTLAQPTNAYQNDHPNFDNQNNQFNPMPPVTNPNNQNQHFSPPHQFFAQNSMPNPTQNNDHPFFPPNESNQL